MRRESYLGSVVTLRRVRYGLATRCIFADRRTKASQDMRSKTRPKGASALTADELRGLLGKLRASSACQRHDLVDPITLFVATGLRISELLGLQWSDFDEDAATLTITGKVIRAAGKGLLRVDETKTAAGRGRYPCPSSRRPSCPRVAACLTSASSQWCSRRRRAPGVIRTISVPAGSMSATI
jgi:integrase